MKGMCAVAGSSHQSTAEESAYGSGLRMAIAAANTGTGIEKSQAIELRRPIR
jgi:hypothetical protein